MMRRCLRSAIALRATGSVEPIFSSSGLARQAVIDCGEAVAGTRSVATAASQRKRLLIWPPWQHAARPPSRRL